MSERDMLELLALVEKHLGVSWLTVADWLRDQNSIDAIEQRLLAYDFAGVVREVEAAARRFAAETHSQFILSGRRGAEWLDSELPDKLVRFDVTNDRAVYQARRNEIELVHGLTAETRQTVNQIIYDGTRSSANPREMARDIRDSIGLTPQQERAVRSYRQALEDGDWGNALSRELSSGHSDRSVRSAQARDGQLTSEQIEQAVERYRQNQLTYRAETIARTEAGRNVHQGLDEATRQAIERGDLQPEEIRREWIHGGGGRYSRSEHVAMDGVVVGWNEDFVLPSGARLRFPHDPNADASETANCRCTIATTLA